MTCCGTSDHDLLPNCFQKTDTPAAPSIGAPNRRCRLIEESLFVPSTTIAHCAKCAVWARVSTTQQNTINELAELRRSAADRDLNVAPEFVTEGSASSKANGNGKGAEFDVRRNELL